MKIILRSLIHTREKGKEFRGVSPIVSIRIGTGRMYTFNFCFFQFVPITVFTLSYIASSSSLANRARVSPPYFSQRANSTSSLMLGVSPPALAASSLNLKNPFQYHYQIKINVPILIFRAGQPVRTELSLQSL